MTIDDAIKMLTDSKEAGVKSIILAFWTAEGFDLPNDDNWECASESVEDRMDWSHTHDHLSDLLKEEIENEKV
jgi:hypothetical protein